MLCAGCKQAEATVHLTEIEGNSIVKVHLCAECAKHKGVAVPVGEALAGLIAKLPGPPADSEPDLACPVCGLTLSRYRQVGRLGCGNCYRAFGAPLAEMIRRLQRGETHAGKTPGQAGPAPDQLQAMLAAAVSREDFEQAAWIRDLLRETGSAEAEAGE